MIQKTKTLKYMGKAPSWKLAGHDSRVYAQHHYTWSMNLVVVFFRSATAVHDQEQMREFNAQLGTAENYNTQVIGVIPAPVEELAQVHKELELKFPLLSDVERRVATHYGLVAGLLFGKYTRPTVLVEDKYNVIYFLSIAEKDDERVAWAAVEDVLKRFPRR